MGGDEVDRGATLLYMRQKLGDPRCACSARTSNPQLGIDCLDRLGCCVVELEVRLLISVFSEAGEIGFIPHFEEPRAHLFFAVARFNMTDECIDEVLPCFGLRMRGVAMPIENAVL